MAPCAPRALRPSAENIVTGHPAGPGGHRSVTIGWLLRPDRFTDLQRPDPPARTSSMRVYTRSEAAASATRRNVRQQLTAKRGPKLRLFPAISAVSRASIAGGVHAKTGGPNLRTQTTHTGMSTKKGFKNTPSAVRRTVNSGTPTLSFSGNFYRLRHSPISSNSRPPDECTEHRENLILAA